MDSVSGYNTSTSISSYNFSSDDSENGSLIFYSRSFEFEQENRKSKIGVRSKNFSLKTTRECNSDNSIKSDKKIEANVHNARNLETIEKGNEIKQSENPSGFDGYSNTPEYILETSSLSANFTSIFSEQEASQKNDYSINSIAYSEQEKSKINKENDCDILDRSSDMSIDLSQIRAGAQYSFHENSISRKEEDGTVLIPLYIEPTNSQKIATDYVKTGMDRNFFAKENEMEGIIRDSNVNSQNNPSNSSKTEIGGFKATNQYVFNDSTNSFESETDIYMISPAHLKVNGYGSKNNRYIKSEEEKDKFSSVIIHLDHNDEEGNIKKPLNTSSKVKNKRPITILHELSGPGTSHEIQNRKDEYNNARKQTKSKKRSKTNTGVKFEKKNSKHGSEAPPYRKKIDNKTDVVNKKKFLGIFEDQSSKSDFSYGKAGLQAIFPGNQEFVNGINEAGNRKNSLKNNVRDNSMARIKEIRESGIKPTKKRYESVGGGDRNSVSLNTKIDTKSQEIHARDVVSIASREYRAEHQDSSLNTRKGAKIKKRSSKTKTIASLMFSTISNIFKEKTVDAVIDERFEYIGDGSKGAIVKLTGISSSRVKSKVNRRTSLDTISSSSSASYSGSDNNSNENHDEMSGFRVEDVNDTESLDRKNNVRTRDVLSLVLDEEDMQDNTFKWYDDSDDDGYAINSSQDDNVCLSVLANRNKERSEPQGQSTSDLSGIRSEASLEGRIEENEHDRQVFERKVNTTGDSEQGPAQKTPQQPKPKSDSEPQLEHDPGFVLQKEQFHQYERTVEHIADSKRLISQASRKNIGTEVSNAHLDDHSISNAPNKSQEKQSADISQNMAVKSERISLAEFSNESFKSIDEESAYKSWRTPSLINDRMYTSESDKKNVAEKPEGNPDEDLDQNSQTGSLLVTQSEKYKPESTPSTTGEIENKNLEFMAPIMIDESRQRGFRRIYSLDNNVQKVGFFGGRADSDGNDLNFRFHSVQSLGKELSIPKYLFNGILFMNSDKTGSKYIRKYSLLYKGTTAASSKRVSFETKAIKKQRLKVGGEREMSEDDENSSSIPSLTTKFHPASLSIEGKTHLLSVLNKIDQRNRENNADYIAMDMARDLLLAEPSLGKVVGSSSPKDSPLRNSSINIISEYTNVYGFSPQGNNSINIEKSVESKSSVSVIENKDCITPETNETQLLMGSPPGFGLEKDSWRSPHGRSPKSTTALRNDVYPMMNSIAVVLSKGAFGLRSFQDVAQVNALNGMEQELEQKLYILLAAHTKKIYQRSIEMYSQLNLQTNGYKQEINDDKYHNYIENAKKAGAGTEVNMGAATGIRTERRKKKGKQGNEKRLHKLPQGGDFENPQDGLSKIDFASDTLNSLSLPVGPTQTTQTLVSSSENVNYCENGHINRQVLLYSFSAAKQILMERIETEAENSDSVNIGVFLNRFFSKEAAILNLPVDMYNDMYSFLDTSIENRGRRRISSDYFLGRSYRKEYNRDSAGEVPCHERKRSQSTGNLTKFSAKSNNHQQENADDVSSIYTAESRGKRPSIRILSPNREQNLIRMSSIYPQIRSQENRISRIELFDVGLEDFSKSNSLTGIKIRNSILTHEKSRKNSSDSNKRSRNAADPHFSKLRINTNQLITNGQSSCVSQYFYENKHSAALHPHAGYSVAPCNIPASTERPVAVNDLVSSYFIKNSEKNDMCSKQKYITREKTGPGPDRQVRFNDEDLITVYIYSDYSDESPSSASTTYSESNVDLYSPLLFTSTSPRGTRFLQQHLSQNTLKHQYQPIVPTTSNLVDSPDINSGEDGSTLDDTRSFNRNSSLGEFNPREISADRAVPQNIDNSLSLAHVSKNIVYAEALPFQGGVEDLTLKTKYNLEDDYYEKSSDYSDIDSDIDSDESTTAHNKTHEISSFSTSVFQKHTFSPFLEFNVANNSNEMDDIIDEEYNYNNNQPVLNNLNGYTSSPNMDTAKTTSDEDIQPGIEIVAPHQVEDSTESEEYTDFSDDEDDDEM